MPKHGRRTAGDGERRGFFDRFIFSFMGPAQLGDHSAPVREVVQPVQLCPKCHRPYDEHETVRTRGLTYSRCP